MYRGSLSKFSRSPPTTFPSSEQVSHHHQPVPTTHPLSYPSVPRKAPLTIKVRTTESIHFQTTFHQPTKRPNKPFHQAPYPKPQTHKAKFHCSISQIPATPPLPSPPLKANSHPFTSPLHPLLNPIRSPQPRHNLIKILASASHNSHPHPEPQSVRRIHISRRNGSAPLAYSCPGKRAYK